MSVTTLVVVGIGLMVPLLLASLGELICERAGVLNIGIEGCMAVGAFFTALTVSSTGNLLSGLGVGLGVGVLVGLLLAWLYIGLQVNQMVAGLMFTVLALGMTSALFERFTQSAQGNLAPRRPVPFLSDIPVIGDMFFNHSVLVYGAVLVVPVVAWFLRSTWWGLLTSAAGENPNALDSAGYSVRRYRAIAVVVASVFASLAGAVLVLATSGRFVSGMTAGRGFIALGVVVVARWHPGRALVVCLLIGITQGIQFQFASVAGLRDIPVDVWVALPYIAAIAAVVIGRHARYPAAITLPWMGHKHR
jgi:ABC-type uncharacterized transport system permease subunit